MDLNEIEKILATSNKNDWIKKIIQSVDFDKATYTYKYDNKLQIKLISHEKIKYTWCNYTDNENNEKYNYVIFYDGQEILRKSFACVDGYRAIIPFPIKKTIYEVKENDVNLAKILDTWELTDEYIELSHFSVVK